MLHKVLKFTADNFNGSNGTYIYIYIYIYASVFLIDKKLKNSKTPCTMVIYSEQTTPPLVKCNPIIKAL